MAITVPVINLTMPTSLFPSSWPSVLEVTVASAWHTSTSERQNNIYQTKQTKMKSFLTLFPLIAFVSVLAQETKSELKTRFDVIRNETVTGANSKTRLANALPRALRTGPLACILFALTGTDTYTGSLQGLDAYTGKIVLSRLKTQIQEHQLLISAARSGNNPQGRFRNLDRVILWRYVAGKL